MNFFEEHGLMLLAAEQGRQQFNRDVAMLLRAGLVRAGLAVRRMRHRLLGTRLRS